MKLQCPACGRAAIFARPFNVKAGCTGCGVIFKREEGFFVGAIMANVVATEVWILIVYFACLLLTNFGDQTTQALRLSPAPRQNPFHASPAGGSRRGGEFGETFRGTRLE